MAKAVYPPSDYYSVSVVIPAKNEEKYIKKTVKTALKCRGVEEVIVVDGGSTDNTREIARRMGAQVIAQSSLKYPGKGIAMRDGYYYSNGDIIVYIDADIKNITTNFIEKLYEPIINNEADFVKGAFERAAGRVTELVAKPLLRLFYPELANYKQPLSGEIAGKRGVFKSVEWPDNWGVDVAILLDVYKSGYRIKEVDLGYKDHEMKPLKLLNEMAYEVARTILERAARDGKIKIQEIESYLTRTLGEAGI